MPKPQLYRQYYFPTNVKRTIHSPETDSYILLTRMHPAETNTRTHIIRIPARYRRNKKKKTLTAKQHVLIRVLDLDGCVVRSIAECVYAKLVFVVFVSLRL